MPYGTLGYYPRLRRVRSAEGRKLDELYKQHKIGWAYYNKIKDKKKYWTWNN